MQQNMKKAADYIRHVSDSRISSGVWGKSKKAGRQNIPAYGCNGKNNAEGENG
jgi:hypothetical protein